MHIKKSLTQALKIFFLFDGTDNCRDDNNFVFFIELLGTATKFNFFYIFQSETK
jgi:hypothetical protein